MSGRRLHLVFGIAAAAALSLTLLIPLGSAALAGAEATLAPTTLTFRDRPVRTRSEAQAVLFRNTGDTPVAISTVRLIGPDADDFSQGIDCPISPDTVPAGGSCTIYVSFRPSSAGPKAATLAIGDDAPSSPQTVALSGGGIAGGAGVATLSRPGVSFRDQVVGTKSEAQAVTLTNTGGGALTISTLRFGGADPQDFSQGVDCPITPDSLPAGEHCTIYVAFTPDSAGPKSASLLIGDDDPSSPQTIALSGAGTVGAGVVSLSPASLSFPDIPVGTRADARRITLTNTGAGPLTISTLRLTGPDAADFAQGVDCPINPDSLAAGASCHIDVSYSPSSPGPKSANLVIGDDDPLGPQTVTLTGGGLSGPRLTLAPGALDFGTQTRDTLSAAQTVILTNTGGSAMTVGTISATGDFADVNHCGATLAAGASCTVSVMFRPRTTGPLTGTLSITDSAPGAPHSVALSGTGILPAFPLLALSPTTISFGDQQVATQSAPRTVTVTNTGGVDMTISSIAFTSSGHFARTTTCGATLVVGASCTIDIRFTPAAVGAQSATLTVSGNAHNSPSSVFVSGNATLPTGTLLVDGFENGLAGWTTLGVFPPATISTTTAAHSGALAAELLRGGSGIGMYENFAGQGRPQTHTSFWLRPGNQFASMLAQGRDVFGRALWEIDYDPGPNRFTVYVWNNAGVRTDLFVNNPLPTASWEGFDIDLNQAVAGRFALAINGATVASVNGNLSAANNYSRLMFWDGSAYGAVNVDDVLVTAP